MLVPQILSFLILGYPENLMSLAKTIKKFKFLRPSLKGTPLLYSQILSYSIFSSYLSILKISSI